MAGIVGVILKEKKRNIHRYETQFRVMLEKLSYSEKQKRDYHVGEWLLFGNCLPISGINNDRFQKNESLKIYVIIEGLVFIPDDERKILSNRYKINTQMSDCQLLPYLFDYYREGIVQRITGWFNIFIYDEYNHEVILFNDRLGYLPLYYYESDSIFIFSSKIESITASGILPEIEFDPVTVSEHLFYNYPLSDNTYIKKVKTLSNAELFKFSSGATTKLKYWDAGELIGQPVLNENDSFTYMNNGLKNAIHKILSQSDSKINISLTGGWDTRVILSYLLPEHRANLNGYSFGAENSGDILIPQYISANENLHYTSFILDDDYLNNLFLKNALETIYLSGGARNYKRAHYLYAIRQISDISDILISGIFGDQVFKVSQIRGGTVITKDTIEILESGFNSDLIYKRFVNSTVLNSINVNKKYLIEEFVERSMRIGNDLKKYDSISEKYYSFRFEYNLRKYFGSEVSSYNDFVYCFSPFIDYDFLKLYAQTKYMVTRFPFNSNSISLKKMSTQLYHALTNYNYSPLTYYNTDRGYTMHDSVSLLGKLKILYKMKFRKKSLHKDSYNTAPTNGIFKNYLLKNSINADILAIEKSGANKSKIADINSLVYWIYRISTNY